MNSEVAHFARFVYWASLLFFASATFASEPVTRPALPTDMSYVRSARLVDIGGGRRMNILCVGTGTPTVVFESGLGDPIRAWAGVQPHIAKRTRACSYDRAGLGFSDPSGRSGTASNAVDDLHLLLNAASIRPPYVLVGHSMGAMYVRLFAARHRFEVAGLVLVDPVSEDQRLRYATLDPSTRTANDKYVEQIRNDCIPAAAKGFDKTSELYKQCVGDPDSRFSANFNDTAAANESTEAHFRAVWSEWVNVFDTSSDQVRSARRDLGDMPLVVLSRSPLRLQPNETQEMREAKNRLWTGLHDDLAQLSRRGVRRVVPKAGHYIQLDQPAAVVEAIHEVLRERE